jgi:hypothetical protein
MKRQGGFRIKPGQSRTQEAVSAASATATGRPIQRGERVSAGVYRNAQGKLYQSKDGYRAGERSEGGPIPGAVNAPRPRGNSPLGMANAAAQGMPNNWEQVRPGSGPRPFPQGQGNPVGGIAGQQGGGQNNWEQVRPGSGPRPFPQYENMQQAQQGGDRLGAYTNFAQGQLGRGNPVGGILPQGQGYSSPAQQAAAVANGYSQRPELSEYGKMRQAAQNVYQQQQGSTYLGGSANFNENTGQYNNGYIPGGDPKEGQNPMVNQILNMSPQQVQGMMNGQQQPGQYQNPQAPMYRPQYVPYRG